MVEEDCTTVITFLFARIPVTLAFEILIHPLVISFNKETGLIKLLEEE